MLLFEQNIPVYLHSSPYWQELLSGGPFPKSGIEIPDGCLKADQGLSSGEDLTELLSTLRFWLLPELLRDSMDLLRFAFCPAHRVHFLNSAEEFQNAFPLVVEIAEIVRQESRKRVEAAVHYGHMHVVQYLVEQVNEPVPEEAGLVASDEEKLDLLKYLHSRGLELTTPICAAACKRGHLDCVKYLLDCKAEQGIFFATNCAAFGHFECVQYAVQNTTNDPEMLSGGMLHQAFRQAAKAGQVECLKLMMAEWQNPRYHEAMVMQAAASGQMRVLQLATQSGVSVTHTPMALEQAAGAGHMECVRYLHEIGCSLTSEALVGAAECGNVDIFVFLVEHNCPTELLVCETLALHGRLELLQYAHEHGCPWDEGTCGAAAEKGHLDCLKYAHEHGCTWKEDRDKHITPPPPVPMVFVGGGFLSINDEGDLTMVHVGPGDEAAFLQEWNEVDEGYPHITASAACAPTVDCLQYVVSQGVALHKKCGWYALHTRCVETLQLLHAHGFTWGAQDCAAVAAAGSVECMRFLHEIGTPWDSFTCRNASSGRHLELLQYAREHGCPWDAQTCKKGGSRECFEYAVAHGCPGAELSRFFQSV